MYAQLIVSLEQKKIDSYGDLKNFTNILVPSIVAIFLFAFFCLFLTNVVIFLLMSYFHSEPTHGNGLMYIGELC